MAMPTRGQHDWDDEVNGTVAAVEATANSAKASADGAVSTANAASTAASAASATAASAQTAATAATAAAGVASSAAAAAQSTANTALANASDAGFAGFVGNGASSTNAAVKAVIDSSPSNYATFWPHRYGAAGNGTTDDTAALQAAIDAAYAAGAGVVMLTKLYRITGAVTVKPGVSLQGINSKLTTLTIATIKLDSSTACLKFATGDVRGGRHGGFNVDANATGSTTGAVQVTTVQQVFDAITITNAPGVGLYVYATQNTEFRSVDVNGCQDNVVVDGGSGGLKWVRCENTSPTRYGLRVYDSAPGGHPTFGYQFGNSDNLWDACIFEHYGTSATNLVRIQSGSRNHFLKCGFSVNGATLTDYVINVSNDDWSASAVIGTNVEFKSCNFHGGATANRPIFYVKGTNTYTGNVLVVSGHSFFQQSTAIFNTDGATVGVIDDHSNYYASTITAKFGALGGANWFFWRAVNPTGIILATPDAAGAWVGHVPLAIRKDTDSTAGSRLYVANDGTMGWPNGTNNVAQVSLTPDTTNKFLTATGIKFSGKKLSGFSSVTVSGSQALTTDCSAIAPKYALILNSSGAVSSWTLSNPTDGQELQLWVTRAGAQTFAWPTNIQWNGNTAPSTTPTANQYTIVNLVYVAASAKWYEHADRSVGVPN